MAVQSLVVPRCCRKIEHLIATVGHFPRILVCGSRSGTNRRLVHHTLDKLHQLSPITRLINGKASGYDTLATEWASLHNIPVSHFLADWRRYGKGAGPMRNKLMLLEGHPNLVVAFPGDRGTAHMASIAQDAHIPVLFAGWDGPHNSEAIT